MRLTDSESLAVHGSTLTTKKRNAARWAVAGLTVIALFVAGWFAAESFQSPEQIAAGADAPKAGPITAPITRGDLARTVSVSVRIVRQTQATAALVGSDEYSVVTRQPTPAGAEVSNGTNVTEINGRPRLAIQGAFPFYRDLAVGDVGPDVAQLQAGLQQSGYKITVDGQFGKSTDNAVRSMYKAAGYEMATRATTEVAPDDSNQGASAVTPATSETVVTRTELVVFATLPAYLVASPAVGTIVDDATTATVEAGRAVATASLEASALSQLQNGMTGTVQGPDGTSQAATVESVGPAVASPSADDEAAGPEGSETTTDVDEFALVVAIDGDSVPEGWLGSEALALITVEIAASDSLIVPTIAVVTAGSDNAHVLRRDADGSFSRIGVREIGTLAGQSAIEPVDVGSLDAGDLVRID
jgi:peptidoglycan hydrolase-like protein with peptidoglycan-binding domain